MAMLLRVPRNTIKPSFYDCLETIALFTVEQLPDLIGQGIIVTGGNTGVGKETCKASLNNNAEVYLAAHSKSKSDATIE
ncbi:hypothetical protein FRC11_010680 [Ceratobasidium sp. 423]|nr:hypothetical protein FRC11_010680 [Ceratobasidium sp. 423]